MGLKPVDFGDHIWCYISVWPPFLGDKDFERRCSISFFSFLTKPNTENISVNCLIYRQIDLEYLVLNGTLLSGYNNWKFYSNSA